MLTPPVLDCPKVIQLVELETYPIWGPVLDDDRCSAPILLKMGSHGKFDHNASWAARVRNVSKAGRQISHVGNTGLPHSETVNLFLFRFESFLGSGRCCARRAITTLDEHGRVIENAEESWMHHRRFRRSLRCFEDQFRQHVPAAEITQPVRLLGFDGG